jgi:galactokinase
VTGPSATWPASSSWRAPGRVNLIGEHTDYNDGFALPLAIEQGCTARVSRVGGAPAITVRSRQRPAPVRIARADLVPGADWLAGPDGWAGYAAGVPWALARLGYAGWPSAGLAVELDSDVPAGAGLSSSAAIGCAVAGALSDLLGLALDGHQRAEVARVAETELVGAPTGGMDQLAATLSVSGHVLLCDMRSLVVQPMPLDLDACGLALLVVDTGAPHSHVAGEYRRRREACARAAAELGVPALRDADLAAVDQITDDTLRRRARHVVTENARVLQAAALLRTGDLEAVGPVLTSSHRSMRDDFEITVPVVDAVVEALLDAGALGARMTGGGFGGCVIALLPSAGADAAAAAVTAMLTRTGFGAPASIFRSRPAGGAHPVPGRSVVASGSRMITERSGGYLPPSSHQSGPPAVGRRAERHERAGSPLRDDGEERRRRDPGRL